ncbi:MAG TPA: hypothetical protein PK771_07730, partial [Spirochaetota bacterium]|nr:hypothetical protein [Spirochaetota bacterium]
MQLKEQKKKKNRLLFFLLSFLLLAIFVGSLFLIYLVIIDIPFSQKLSKKVNNEQLLKLAESMYNDGYLENSALYYRNYLETNPNKMSKIKVYEKLFQINVIRNKFDDALKYLDLWEIIDGKNPKIFIQRIKLLFRMNSFQQIKLEIDKNYDKLNKSTEFKDLVAIYFIKIGNFEKALQILEQIPYNKREFFIHRKFLYCYINLDMIKEAKDYIKKIDNKVKYFEVKENKIEFSILKAITHILNDDYVFAEMELKNLSVTSKYQNLYLKIFLYCNIKLERTDEINAIIENNSELNFDFEYYKIVADYYFYKKEYKKALEFYNKIEQQRNLTKQEVMLLSDIYFNLKDYNKSLETINILNKDYSYDTPDLYKNLSVNYNLLGDSANELFYLKEGMNRYPIDLDFYVRLGKFYLDYRDYSSAIRVSENAEKIFRQNNNLSYDKRLDLVKLIAMENNNPRIEELELLKLREKNNTNPEYYFKIIEYYLKDKRFVDAFREIQNANALSLNDEQIEILTLYKLIYANFRDNGLLYNEAKSILLKSNKESISTKINLGIVHILDEDFDLALDILNKINPQLLE